MKQKSQVVPGHVSVKLNKEYLCIMKYLSIFLLIFVKFSLVSQGAYPFHNMDKWYLVDSSFLRIGKHNYTFIIPVNQTRFIVKNKRGLLGMIDERDNFIIPDKYDKLEPSGEWYTCSKNGKKYLLDFFGKPVKQLSYGICGYSEGVVSWINTFEKDGKVGFSYYSLALNRYDSTEAIYDVVTETGSKVVFARIKNKWGMVNERGEIIQDFIFDSVQISTHCYEGRLQCISIYKIGDLKGYIDNTGKLLTAAKYPQANFFGEKYALVKDKNGLCGYIDITGREYFK